MATESDIQTAVIQFLRGRGCYVLNVGGNASTAKGTSDLIVCYRGQFIGMELKKLVDSYGVTKPQEIRMRQIAAAGGLHGVVTSITEANAILNAIDWMIGSHSR